MPSRSEAPGISIGVKAIKSGPKIVANFPTMLKNPKNSAVLDGGTRRA